MAEAESAVKRRFDDLLPWYVNGTLDEVDRRWVDDYLRDHSDAAALHRWHATLAEQMRESPPTPTADAGYARLLARIKETDRVLPTARARALGRRIREFWEGLGVSPAFALGGLLVVLQAGVIAGLLLDRERSEPATTEVRSTTEPAPAGYVLIRVSFSPNARERDIRFLLVSVGGALTSGPSQLGDYIVRVPADNQAEALQKLQTDPVVATVSVLGEAPR